MITATCKTEKCVHENVPFFILGNPPHVMCGGCFTNAEMTDPTDDPQEENYER